MNRLRPTTVLILLLALVVGSTAGAPIALAGEPQRSPLAKGTFTALVSSDSGLTLGAAGGSRVAGPKPTRFTARVAEPVRSRLQVELSGDVEVERLSLRYEQAGGPSDALEIKPVVGNEAGSWQPGKDLPLDGGVDSLEWRFERAGTYTIRMVATADLVRPAPVASTEPGVDQAADDAEPRLPQATREEVSATADYVIEVSEPTEAAVPPDAERTAEAEADPDSTKAEATAERQSATPAAQRVARTAVAGAEDRDRSIVLTKGHIDLFEVTYADGGLRLAVKDDTGLYGTGVQYRSPDEVSLWVDTALAAYDTSDLPAAYSFLKDAASTVYLLPLSQNPELPWPGWSTERLAGTLPAGVQLASSGSPVRLEVAVDGPGEVFTWMTGAFGAVTNKYIDTVDPAADVIPIARNAHVHTAWAFTAPGDYYLTVSPSATTTEETVTGPSSVYHIQVGPIVEAAPQAVTAPSISGSGEIGGLLRLNAGSWFPSPHGLTQQWLRDGEPIEGATGTEYTPTQSDDGHAISATVTARIGGASNSAQAPGLVIGGEPGGEDPDPGPGDPAVEVPNGSLTNSGATILNRGHVDVASLLEGGRLVTRVKDTTESAAPTWRDPAKTVLQALPRAKTKVPTGAAFRFLGTAGDDLWLLPETQDHSLLWPGWSTEEIPDAATRTGFDWRLTDIDGPGEFALFTSGAFGEPKVLFNTRDGLPDAAVIGKRVHVHGSWAFSAQGVYCLAFDRATTLAGGAQASDEFTIAVAVGQVAVKQVDPGKCFTQPADKPGADDTVPVPEAELTEATAGGVQVLNGGRGFSAGQLVTVQIGAGRVGEWVSVWLHSEPVWLGWAQVGSSGAVQARLPASAAPGAHKLVVKDRSGTLIGWDDLTVTKPADSPDPPDEVDDKGGNGKGSASNKNSSRKCVGNAVVLSSGHIDYTSRIVSGRLQSYVGDDTGAKKVFREPSGVVLWLKPASKVTLPSGYGQVGPAGSAIWQVPQTQKAGLIWLGWSTEALNAGNARGSVSWRLNSVSGPGSVKVYLAGAFGGVQTMAFKGSGSSYSIPLGVHAHANWAFSRQGIYRLRMTQTVTLANGQRSSDTETLTIAVGDVDPNSAARCGGKGGTQLLAGETTDPTGLEAAEQAAAEAAMISGGPAAGPAPSLLPTALPNPVEELAQGSAVPLLLTVLGGLLLTGAAGTGGYWWWRRRWPDVGSQPAGAA